MQCGVVSSAWRASGVGVHRGHERMTVRRTWQSPIAPCRARRALPEPPATTRAFVGTGGVARLRTQAASARETVGALWGGTVGLVALLSDHTIAFMRFEDHITVTPGVRSGKPCIRGTRITVANVLEYFAGGMTEAEILADFPDLRSEHIRAVFSFAAARERRLAEPPAA